MTQNMTSRTRGGHYSAVNECLDFLILYLSFNLNLYKVNKTYKHLQNEMSTSILLYKLNRSKFVITLKVMCHLPSWIIEKALRKKKN